ncbi:hypothetical protein OTB20_40615 [Streptomyces sp. H27-H1]|uniref:hypothetical protein n=1 Tax=Streptomyces sp. H27-H1 TaxID=2996461 RepID=UPI00226F5A5E|nr:hypothetical protein [Streptomyces sp. H27-H1]MCY0932347.1 hypothetical protein [Streptomyces sp. H27-H1]
MLRFKNIVKTVQAEVTRDGKTHTYDKPVTSRVPMAPRNWDVVGIRAAASVVLGLTAVAVIWSTVSIGALLEGGVGYAAAGLFDAAWITCIILEVLARYDRDKRKFARVLGYILVAATMGAIFWHGWVAGSIPLAVVGAAVSAVAKVLWLGVLKFIDRDLGPADAAWLEGENSKAALMLARAQVQRQVARAEAGVIGELLAIEHQHREMAEALGMTREEYQELRVRALGAADSTPVAAIPVGKPTEVTELPEVTEVSVERAPVGNLGQTSGITNTQVNTGTVPAIALVVPAPIDFGKPEADLGKPVSPVGLPTPLAASVEMGKPAHSADRASGKPLGKPLSGTIAEAVRVAVSMEIFDTDAIAAKVPELMEMQPNRYSVRREINRQRPAIDAAKAAQEEKAQTGLYM